MTRMTTHNTAAPGSLIGACYCVGVLLIAVSALDYAGTILPAAWGDVGWRYGAAGLLSGFTLTPLLGGLVLVVAAAWAAHGRFLRVLAVIHLVAAVLLLVLIAGFSLDALQARKDATTELQRVTEISTLKALVKLGATVVAVGWIGLSAWRQARRVGGGGAAAGPGLLVGR